MPGHLRAELPSLQDFYLLLGYMVAKAHTNPRLGEGQRAEKGRESGGREHRRATRASVSPSPEEHQAAPRRGSRLRERRTMGWRGALGAQSPGGWRGSAQLGGAQGPRRRRQAKAPSAVTVGVRPSDPGTAQGERREAEAALTLPGVGLPLTSSANRWTWQGQP